MDQQSTNEAVNNRKKEIRENAFRARISIPNKNKVIHIGYFLTEEEQRKAESDVEAEVTHQLNKIGGKSDDIEKLYKEACKKLYAGRKRGRKSKEGITQRNKFMEMDFVYKNELENYKIPVDSYVAPVVRAGRKLIRIGKFSNNTIAKEAKQFLINKCEKEIDEKCAQPSDQDVFKIYANICRSLFPRKRNTKQFILSS